MSNLLEFKQQLKDAEKNFKDAALKDFCLLKTICPEINYFEFNLLYLYNDEGGYDLLPAEDDIILNITNSSGEEQNIQLSIFDTERLDLKNKNEILLFCKNILSLPFNNFLSISSEETYIKIDSNKVEIID